MRKSTFARVLCICLTGAFLTGCSETVPNDSSSPEIQDAVTEAVTTEDPTTEEEENTPTEAETTTEETVVTPEVVEIPEDAPEWEKTYRTVLNSYIENRSYESLRYKFSLYDITDDGIPEMFVSEWAHTGDSWTAYDPVHIFSCSEEGELIEIGDFGCYGQIGYDVTRHYLMAYRTEHGLYDYAVAQVSEDNELETLFKATYNGSPNYINNEEASEEEFDAAMELYDFDNDLIELGAHYDDSVQDINSAFAEYSTDDEALEKKTYKWRRAYRSVLNGYMEDEAYRFSLYDVNEDGVPELFVGRPTDDIDATCAVYTFSDESGELVTLGDFGAWGTLQFLPETGLLHSYRFGTRTEWGTLLRLREDLTLDTILDYSAETPDDPSELHYFIDGKEVSRNEYDAICKMYSVSEHGTVLGRDEEITDYSIDVAFDRMISPDQAESETPDAVG